MVHRNILKFLLRRSGRGINLYMKMYSLFLMFSVPVSYTYFILTVWVKAPSKYIGTYGCYANVYFYSFSEFHANSYMG